MVNQPAAKPLESSSLSTEKYTVHPYNQSLVNTFHERYDVYSTTRQLTLFTNVDGIDILLVDAYSEPYHLDPKQAVGLARKIGNDIALTLIQQERIKRPWLFNTDVDAALPADYFQIINQTNTSHSNIACYVYPYQHSNVDDIELNNAMLSYQQYLNHYVEGLRFAGSPYAWHSLGSILCISAEHYAMVRGFPKRSAGEDFHLLNKLTKVGEIYSINQPIITLFTRLSMRVPFGTGPSLNAIINGNDKQHFNHGSFIVLKQWIDSWPILWDKKNELDPLASTKLEQSHQQILYSLGMNKLIRHSLKQSANIEGFYKQMHTGFDALKTLQFLKAINQYIINTVSQKL